MVTVPLVPSRPLLRAKTSVVRGAHHSRKAATLPHGGRTGYADQGRRVPERRPATMTSRRRRLAARRKVCGFNQEEFAEAVGVDRSTVQRWESGKNDPQPWQRPRIAKVLAITAAELDALLVPDAYAPPASRNSWVAADSADSDDEFDALELARRVSASDVGRETLDRLEFAFDDLATKYPVSPPQDLLRRVRKHSAYVARLMDARMTLTEQRRLYVVGGWFQLLGATLHIDLHQNDAATARLQTAATLAQHAEHREIEAWCYETDAWRVLTDGDYKRALELSLIAQNLAPSGTSAAIQATAQEGRARARLGEGRKHIPPSNGSTACQKEWFHERKPSIITNMIQARRLLTPRQRLHGSETRRPKDLPVR
ncbi:helix-turn-helix transcriptional regulator [Streptomyces sp. C8S0]|uniref:helix-turn-helix transcriptional regulator n=1 Tax=Streptomyces sp. C8S0 TaxID=2585716 RepID=UPI00299F7310|nr:helix-turn-helix transcriptional regulator [Streptomyces sp. C8S0]